jgi:hypothetical protein
MEISGTLNKFIEEQNIEFHRFKSWEHCYNFFQKKYFINSYNKEDNDDLAALNLGFYLASWGMYRGSTFLLQNDYKIHTNVVKFLKEFYKKDEYKFDEIIFLKDKISAIYRNSATPNSSKNSTPSDTLITKILLGTYGCIPAYDRFFIEGFNSIIGSTCSFDKDKFDLLNKYYEDNKKKFTGFEKNYPKMKLLDMYFWKIGYDISIEEKLKKKNNS